MHLTACMSSQLSWSVEVMAFWAWRDNWEAVDVTNHSPLLRCLSVFQALINHSPLLHHLSGFQALTNHPHCCIIWLPGFN